MSTRVIARRYTLEVPEAARPGSTVWRGRDSTNGAAVVVTLLDEHPAAAATLAALAAIRHPALPVVLDHGTDGITHYVITPQRSGRTVQARLATEGPLPAEEAAEFTAEVADALAALHARGLVQGRLGLGAIVRDEGGPLRLEDCATAALARPADQPDDDVRQLAGLLRELLGLAPDANPLEAAGVPPRLAGLLQSLSSFTPPPAADARDVLRRLAREQSSAEWEPFPAAAVAVADPAAPAPARRNRGLKLLVGLLALGVLVLGAIVVADVVDRRDADRRAAAATALPGPITTVPPTGADDGDFTLPTAVPTETVVTTVETAETTTTPAPVGPSRTPKPLRIASITPLDPAGDNRENDAQARLAIDGSPQTGWTTELYKPGAIESKYGIGLHLRLAVPSRVRRVTLASAPVGATVVIYGIRGPVPARAPRDWTLLADAKELARPLTVIPIRRTAPLTDVLIWITGLPPVKGGHAVTFKEIRLIGVPTGA